MLNYGQLADRVAVSYHEAPRITLDNPVVHADDDIRLVLDQRADELLVVVPGTTDLAGWLDDFAIWPRWFDELGSYHEGFGSKGIALFRALEPRLPVPGHGMLTTYVGHSLGAALARVLAILHHHSYFGAYRLVTFGEPRGAAFWNVRARASLETARDMQRFVREGDPICNMPFLPLYKHLSQMALGREIGARANSLDPMASHNIALYASDLKTLNI